MASAKILEARFYRLTSGAEPVRDWLLSLDREERRRVGVAIAKVEMGWPIGLPVCRPMGEGLFEVRVSLNGRIARVLFAIENERMLLLHGFLKTTQKTPKADLDLARWRMRRAE